MSLDRRRVFALCALLVLAWPCATRGEPAAKHPEDDTPSFPPRPSPILQWPQVAAGLSGEERDSARRLFEKLAQKTACASIDAEAAAALASRPNAGSALRELAAAVLVSAAQQAAHDRDCDSARERLRQADAYSDDHGYVASASLAVLLDCAAWPEAEAAARDLLARDASDDEAGFVLGYALLRQGRDQEALDTWDASPRLRERPVARRLRSRLAKSLAVESGLRETQVSRFSLRYDGERHEALGERVLAALERHFDTLASTFDYQPQEPITVILLTREAYYDGSGAPRWSGGEFTSYDGRVRVPVLGVTPERVRELEGTLMHELTHVFVFGLTHGAADWDLQEGLAQYMEGKRSSSAPTPVRADAASRDVERVRLKYALALSFVEFLMTEGDVASLQVLLRRLGTGGSVDAAWQEAYGRSRAELTAAWQKTLHPDTP